MYRILFDDLHTLPRLFQPPIRFIDLRIKFAKKRKPLLMLSST